MQKYINFAKFGTHIHTTNTNICKPMQRLIVIFQKYEEMVITLNDSNFEMALKENDLIVIEYQANWCGSCRLFAPKYEALSNEPQFSNVVFAKIDAENNPKAKSIVTFDYIPYFATFKNGTFHEGLSTVNSEVLTMMIRELGKHTVKQY
jgi:Thioredoxin.